MEFDTWHNPTNNDPDSNHLGIDINGSVDHGSGSPNTISIPERFDDGALWYGWVDYDGVTLEARVNQTGVRPGAATLFRTLDLVGILEQNTAYVGFTSGTGLDWGNHDILSWTYRDNYNPIGAVPEPSSIAIFAVLGMTISLRRRRRQRV